VNQGTYSARADSVEPNEILYNKVMEDIAVLDAFTWEGIYYVLGAYGGASNVNKRFLEKLSYYELRNKPSWITKTWVEKDIFGLGMSKNSRAVSWMEAENNAWADIAAQMARKIKVGTSIVTEDAYFDLRSQWIHEGTKTLRGSQIIYRWESASKTKFVLIKAPVQ